MTGGAGGRSELSLRAPAKINLYLAVLGRRPDGYHELVTIMQAVDLCDELRLRLVPRDSRPGRVEGRGAEPEVRLQLAHPAPGVPEGSENLAARAGALVLEQAGAAAELALEIVLDKRIPAGGGLGGGSSDAAAVLVGTNRLLGAPLDADALAALAARLGSDTCFFLQGGTALCTGRGERVQPLVPPQPFEVTLLLPPFGTPTARVYAALDAPPCAPDARRDDELAALHRAAGGADVAALERLFRNDLEAPARAVDPRLAALLDRTRLHLSGSGSTLFGFGRVAENLQAECQPTSICLARSHFGKP
jgi:4-diphosphocytidyl-2-C-methyl-D-erythritol kinase